MMTPRAVLSRFALVPFVWWLGHTLLATSACAAVHYVSPDGDDANPGTGDSPWQTLRHAWSQLDAGDTLRLMDGVHTITEETGMAEGGHADAWITIEPAENADPVVQGSMVFEDRTKLWITSYIRIRNLTFTNNGHFPLLLRGSHIIVENCTFHTCGAFMWTDPGYDITIRSNDFWFDNPRGRTGIRLRARSAVIENNTFHWTADGYAYAAIVTWGQASNIEVRYNTFVGPPDKYISGECVWMGALYSYRDWVANNGDWESSNIIVHDNIMLNCPVAAVSFSHARDCGFYNNTYYNSTYTELVVGVYGVLHDKDGSPTGRDPTLYHDPKNITIKNNLFYSGYPGTDKPVLQVYPYCDTGLQCDNNLWYTGSANEPYVYWMLSGLMPFADYVGQTGHDASSVLSDPILQDPGSGDLHLLSNSPAIDAGAAPPQSWPDFDANPRPIGNGYDIGSYEYTSAPPDTTPPDPVAGLTATDHADDNGGAIDVDWSGYDAPPDFKEYSVYRKTEAFTNVSGMTPIATVTNPAVTQHTDATTTDGTNYYYAITCVDAAGNENTSVTTTGPTQSMNDSKPAPITAVMAHDRDGDDGGAIDLSWSGYAAPPDFDHYNIYRSQSHITDVTGLSPIGAVEQAATTSYTDATTTDGTDYYYAVTCVDTAGNEDESVTDVGPVQSSTDDSAPPPITTLTAQDRLDDNGGAIELDWSGYQPPVDFDHYNIYRGESEMTDVTGLSPIGAVEQAATTSYTDATTTDGADYHYAVTCVDTAGNEDAAITAVGPVHSVPNLQSHTFQGGVRLVTMPATPSDPGLSASDVLGTNLIVAWDPARQTYVYLNAAPDDPLFTIAPGCGFWVFFSEETTVSFLGSALSGGTPFEKSVSPGWNIIGNPWRTDMPWTSLSGPPDGSIAGMGWIYDPETGYVIVNSTGGLNAATSVPAYEAFWILAGSDADKVIINPSGGAQSAARSVDALPIRWLVPIVVSAGDKRDVCNGIGAADADVLIDNPPLVPEGVDAFITPVANPNARMAYELRSATGTQRFNLTVATELPNTDVIVAMPDLSQLPKDYRVTLRDLDTGKLRHMRTARAYTYNSGPAGGQRQFEVEVGPTAGGALTVTGATVVPSRGTGAEIRYNVSEAASVTTRIYNVAGRLVAELERGRSVARGAVATLWDGRSAMGTVAPSGTYVVEIVAAGSDGQRARAVYPFFVSR